MSVILLLLFLIIIMFIASRIKPEALFLKLAVFIVVSILILSFFKSIESIIFIVILAAGMFFIPALFSNIAYQAALKGNFKQAEQFINYYKILIPHKRSFKLTEMIKALSIAENNKPDEAKAIFFNFFSDEDPETSASAFTLYGYIFDYGDLVEWFNNNYFSQNKELPKQYHSMYIRALLDRLQINEAVEYFSKVENSFSSSYLDTFRKNLAILSIFAFTGRKKRITELAKKLYPFNEVSRKSWMAIAELASGNTEEGNRIFNEIYSKIPVSRRNRIDRVKSDLSGAPDNLNLTEETINIINNLETKYSTPVRSIHEKIKPILLKIILVLLLLIALLLLFYVYYKPACPGRNYYQASTNETIQNSANELLISNFNWAINKNKWEIIRYAEHNKRNFRDFYFHVYPEVNGMVSNVILQDWRFNYKGKKYIGSFVDSYNKINDVDGESISVSKEVYIYDTNGHFIISLKQNEYENKKIQCLVVAEGSAINTETVIWQNRKDKSNYETIIKKYAKPEYPYVEDTILYFQRNNLNKIKLNQPYNFTYFSPEEKDLQEYQVTLVKKKLKTKKEPWTMLFKTKYPNNNSFDAYYDSITDIPVKTVSGTMEFIPCSIKKLISERISKIDEYYTNTIPLDCWLVGMDKIKGLKVKLKAVSNKDIYPLFKNNSRQKVQKTPESTGELVLTIKTETESEKPEDKTIDPKEIKRALASTVQIQSNNKEIKILSAKIIKNEKNTVKKALLLARWVNKNIKWTYEVAAGDAMQTLKTRKGDCTEHAVLFIALARAAGIPARIAGGWCMSSNEVTEHAWAEIFSGRWIEIDPSNGKLAGANYIQAEQSILSSDLDPIQILEINNNGKSEIVDKDQPYWKIKGDTYINRILGLSFKKPDYTTMTAIDVYPDWAFMSYNNEEVPQSPPKGIYNYLAYIRIKPSLSDISGYINNMQLANDDVYLTISNNDGKLFTDFNTFNAQNAVFNGVSRDDAWIMLKDGHKFLVERFVYHYNSYSLSITTSINERYNISFLIYGKLAGDKHYKDIPQLILDMIKSIKQTSPDIDGNMALDDYASQFQ